MASSSDPIAALVDDEDGFIAGSEGTIDKVFGNRPAVLDSIRHAVKRGIPKTRIAVRLTEGLRQEGVTNVTIKAGHLKSWLDKNPI